MNNLQPWAPLTPVFIVLEGERVGNWTTEKESAMLGLIACAADGRELSIADHPELHGMIGDAYGEAGKGMFKLPDCRGAVVGGIRSVAMTTSDIDHHDHGRRA